MSDVQIPLAFLGNPLQAIQQLPLPLALGQLFDLAADGRLAGGAGLGRGVIQQVLHQRAQGVGRAEVLDEAGDGELHELLARAAEPIAGGAETGDVAVDQQFADHGVQRADVAELELLALGGLRLAGLGVSAQLDAAAGVDLRDAEGQNLAAHGRRLAGRADQAGVGNRQPQDGHQPLEIGVARPGAFRRAARRCAGRSRGKLIVCGPVL